MSMKDDRGESVSEQSQKTESKNETPLEGFASICSILAIGLFALTFIFQNFMIPSSSMASTLLVGDHVMVERVHLASSNTMPFMPQRDVKRGDVIVFFKPVAEADGDHPHLVKRVIGIPGDRIHLRNGIVYLNGVAQSEPYAAKTTYATYDPYVDDFPLISPGDHFGVTPEWAGQMPGYLQGDDLVIPPGKYFAMGDNRDNSLDSRYWGFVPRENIVGRALLVYWSINMPESSDEHPLLAERASSTLHEALHFFDETRWSRTFHRIE
jgi:signal peptidase I